MRHFFWAIFIIIPLAAETFDFEGVHFFGSYLDCDLEALEDVDSLRKAFTSAVEACGATILDRVEYVFPPNGLTLVILLSESHASIHTYPEHGACFIDLFTCGSSCSFQAFDECLRAYLLPKRSETRALLRSHAIGTLSQ